MGFEHTGGNQEEGRLKPGSRRGKRPRTLPAQISIRLMFYVFLLIVAVTGIAIYLLFILREVPGAAEERLGRLEDLPDDLGVWKQDDDSPEGAAALKRGELRETRFFYDSGGGGFRGGRLLKQVRYRSLATNDILRAEADELVKRKRVRKGSEARS